MAERVLTLRELNRATLDRQLLLRRHDMPVPAALARLAGMQAQLPQPPFVGLWSRLEGFEREHLSALIQSRQAVRATFQRATLHLLTSEDYMRFRTTIQPVLDVAGANIAGRNGAVFDRAVILAAARQFISETPRTFAEISAMLTELQPGVDIGAMRYTVRTQLRLVQVPNSSPWSYPGNPSFTLAEPYIDRELDPETHEQDLVRRYLAAFGPATTRDMQTWSSLTNLKDAFEALRPQLVIYRDERKRELFDLPEIEIPSANMPAPVRFLPEFDNILLSHQLRTRIIADEFRKRVYLPGLRVAATFLVDGFVAGVWKVALTKKTAAITLEPFAAPTPKVRAALAEEAERLVRFIEPTAAHYAVHFAE